MGRSNERLRDLGRVAYNEAFTNNTLRHDFDQLEPSRQELWIKVAKAVIVAADDWNNELNVPSSPSDQ